MIRRPWQSFFGLTSNSFVEGLVPAARDVSPDDLVAMDSHRKEERMAACNGVDPIRIVLAYAQDKLAYDEQGGVISVGNRRYYDELPRERRLNKFGLAYRPDAQFYLHRTLADIVVGAAIYLHQTQGWTTVLYDGLRTMEGAYNLYMFASDTDISSGLLALPGESAHNKGLAVDSMMETADGKEIDMGGHFDHLDMATNIRTYNGPAISDEAKKNRLIREAAFLRSAFTQKLLIAPLRNEFWDDRLPENRADLWRVLDSAMRCMGLSLLTEADETERRMNRNAFKAKWEHWTYDQFLSRWRNAFKGHEAALQEKLGIITPPLELPEFYHGNYNPVYDHALRTSGKHLTEEKAAA